MVSVSVKLINKNDNKENTMTFDGDNLDVKNEADTVLNFRNDMSFMELHEKTKVRYFGNN